MVTWTKNNPQPAGNYHASDDTISITNGYEWFFVLQNDPAEFRAYGDKPVYNYIATNVNSEHFDGHGAVMRMEVAEWFIKNFTKKNDIVLDPFMGTGTTAIACQNLGRRWIGIELIDKYADMAEKRIAEETVQMRFI